MRDEQADTKTDNKNDKQRHQQRMMTSADSDGRMMMSAYTLIPYDNLNAEDIEKI